MVIDTFYENGTKIIFSYFPAWEMFFSMHVLANPEHHGTRKKWVDEKEKQFPELVKKIRELKELADDWNLIIDSPLWSQFRQMEIPEMLSALEKKNIINRYTKEKSYFSDQDWLGFLRERLCAAKSRDLKNGQRTSIPG